MLQQEREKLKNLLLELFAERTNQDRVLSTGGRNLIVSALRFLASARNDRIKYLIMRDMIETHAVLFSFCKRFVLYEE